jgi:hypothetical protein
MAGRVKRPLGELFGWRYFGVNPRRKSALHHSGKPAMLIISPTAAKATSSISGSAITAPVKKAPVRKPRSMDFYPQGWHAALSQA